MTGAIEKRSKLAGTLKMDREREMGMARRIHLSGESRYTGLRINYLATAVSKFTRKAPIKPEQGAQLVRWGVADWLL